MKRCLLLPLIILFSSISCLFALDNKIEKYFSFTINHRFEIASGVINEYVFDKACLNTDNKLSQLDWNIKALAVFNLNTDFNILKYGNLSLSCSLAVPQRSDYMQDYDWENSIGDQMGHPEWMDDDPTENTSFSEHVNHLDKYINYQVSLGGNIYLPLEIKITPYAAYYYEFIKFSSSQGYGIYKSYDFEVYPFTGKVISYEQQINTVLFGIKLKADCIPRTSINIDFNISPNLAKLNAIDYHLTRNKAFNDRFNTLTLINSELTALYRFTKNHRAGFSGKIQYIPLKKGDTFEGTTNSEGKITSNNWTQAGKDSGGTERFIWTFGFNYSFSL